MKIVQFGLHHSPNVGDGIIAECILHGLRELVPGAELATIDISGRDGPGAVTVRNRALVLRVMRLLPRALRQRLVLSRIGAMLDRVEPGWRTTLAGADLAIIGGGQIFSDADLNFCVKLARVAAILRDARVPAVIHAAGVSRNWSPRGAGLFCALFGTDLRAVGLRDAPSVAAWTAQTGGRGPVPVLTRDPGLLAAACYGAPARPGSRTGLCVTDPAILGYHADGEVAGAGGGIGFFAALALALVAQGHEVTLFCNGAAEDRAALARLLTDPALSDALADGRITSAPAPDLPSDLARIIRDCGAVVAHRLHACIVAYGYGLPIVGMGWDRKVESFFASVEQSDHFIGNADTTPDRIATVATQAHAAGIDPKVHARVLAETRAALADAVAMTDRGAKASS